MSAAREAFFDTIEIIKALTSDQILTDVFPPTDPHNNRARILRSGLVVSTFAHLESYLEERLEEVVQGLASSSITYALFGDRLRRFFSVEAVYGLGQRIGYMEKSDALAYVEAHLPRLAGFAAIPPIFTAMGFSSSANVSVSDVGNLLGSLGLSHGWQKLNGICTQVGISRLSLQNDFQNLIRIRNSSAHDSTTNVPSADLVSHVETAVLLGLSVDIAVTHTIKCYTKARTSQRAVAAANKFALKLRFLDEDTAGRWRERSANGKTLRFHPDLASARTAGTRPFGGFVVRDARLFPVRLL